VHVLRCAGCVFIERCVNMYCIYISICIHASKITDVASRHVFNIDIQSAFYRHMYMDLRLAKLKAVSLRKSFLRHNGL
jgi:hypothetical protein